MNKLILVVTFLITFFGACKRTEKYYKTSFKEFPFLPDNEVIGGGQLKDIKSFTPREIEVDTYGEQKYYEGTFLISLDEKNYKAGVELWVTNGQIAVTIIRIPSDVNVMLEIFEKLSMKFKFTKDIDKDLNEPPERGIFKEYKFENSKIEIALRNKIELFSYSTLDGMEERQFTELEIDSKEKIIEKVSN